MAFQFISCCHRHPVHTRIHLLIKPVPSASYALGILITFARLWCEGRPPTAGWTFTNPFEKTTLFLEFLLTELSFFFR